LFLGFAVVSMGSAAARDWHFAWEGPGQGGASPGAMMVIPVAG